jgi:regulator of sirC expression with transglutaminase-like and TPR domain
VKQKELIALIHLLEDDDVSVYAHVSDKLKSLGMPIIEKLEEVALNTEEPVLASRIEDLMQQIKWQDLLQNFSLWSISNDPDVLRGNYLISKFCHQQVQFDLMYDSMQRIKKQIWMELHQYLTPFEQISIINQVLFIHEDFQSIGPNEPQIHHYSLSSVLQTKKGNSLSLGVMYIILAEMLHIPIYGVFLPKHFILAYCKDYRSNKILTQDDVLFYINPMNKGAVFTRNEIKEYLKESGIEDEPKYYIPIDNLALIEGQLKHLQQLYLLKGKTDEAEKIGVLLDTLNKS